VFIAFCFFIIKSKRAFTNITIYLNTLIITLIIIESIKVFINISSPAQDYKLGLKNTINPEELQLKVGPDTAPDIYYIVLDSYTSSKSLKEFWNYDNSEFTDYLKSKGFYIAEDSKSPYPYTNISIPSTLNMSYIYQGTDWKKLLKYSIVINLLTSNGYDFINFSLFDIGTQEKYYIFPDSGNYPSVIFNKTIPATIINRILERQMGDINLEIFSKIKEISSSKHKKPVLVYGHLMMPHAFYLFDEHGNRMPETYFSDIYDKNKYLKQLIFTNKLAIDCVETILSKSVNKPIIIIKGDHGARIFKSPGEEDTYKKEAFSIFNAYYLPDGGNKLLYSSISQVNDFRIIFNYYFHTKLKLIK